MNQPPQDPLSMLFGLWKKIGEETSQRLGDETANLFVYLYNDSVEIGGAVGAAYPKEEVCQSLVNLELIGLLKELSCLHVLFLSGNYPIVLSRLRFNWERIFRACHADMYALENPGADPRAGADRG